MKQQSKAPIPLPCLEKPDLPAGCDAFIQVALAKDPDERFPDAEALAVALGGALGDRRRSG